MNRAAVSGTVPARDSRFDPDAPHPARVYNYWLGGKDHYPADRKAAHEVTRVRPQVVAGARANRAFLARVVRYLAAEAGVRQFLDIGTGLPAPDSTHEVAQSVARDSRIVYVDNDPLVLVYARALLTSAGEGACGYVDADVRDTGTILEQAAHTLDLSKPVAALLLALLHLIPDADSPAAIVARLVDGLAPGSYVAISHMTADTAPAEVTAAADAYNAQAPIPVTARSHTEVTALFGGLPWWLPAWCPSPNGGPTAAASLPSLRTSTPVSPAYRRGGHEVGASAAGRAAGSLMSRLSGVVSELSEFEADAFGAGTEWLLWGAGTPARPFGPANREVHTPGAVTALAVAPQA